jgi:hypothetical protein
MRTVVMLHAKRDVCVLCAHGFCAGIMLSIDQAQALFDLRESVTKLLGL